MNHQLHPDINRDAWLEFRESHLGASEAAAAVGMSPWKSPGELWLEKTGRKEPDDLSDNEAVHWGNILEQVVADEYVRRTGKKVRRDLKTRTADGWEVQSATLDRTIVSNSEWGTGVLECKNVGLYSGRDWGEFEGDDVPPHYYIQVQHQLAVTGYKWAVLAVLIGGQEYRHYAFERNETVISDLTTLEMDFWTHVVDDTPPPVNPRDPRAVQTLQAMYPGTNGETIELSEEIAPWTEVDSDAKETIKRNKVVRDEAKARVLDAMGESAIGVLPMVGTYTRKADKNKIMRLTFRRTK